MIVVFSLLVFVAVSLMVLAAYYAASAESPLERRLRAMVPAAAGGPADRQPTSTGLQRALAALGRYSFGHDRASLAQTLSSAGLRGANAIPMFLGARTLISFGPALLVLLPTLSRGRPLAQSVWVAALLWGVGHVAANVLLRRRAQERMRRLSEGLPDTLDLMVVCLESGLGLNATIARVGEERAAMDDPLGNEFAQVAFELRSGRSREDALRSFGDRNGVEDLKALAGLVIQSDRLGASMAKTLRAHADLLRIKRRQRAEEHARKLPIKVLFPLAVLLLPPLFIMMAGPAFLRMRELTRLITER